MRGIAASVQLVVAGDGLDDHFHRLKAILKSDAETPATYNSLKVRCDGGSMTEYRRAKERLIDSFLESDPVAGNGSAVVVPRPGIHE